MPSVIKTEGSRGGSSLAPILGGGRDLGPQCLDLLAEVLEFLLHRLLLGICHPGSLRRRRRCQGNGDVALVVAAQRVEADSGGGSTQRPRKSLDAADGMIARGA